ncbi:MAG: hypothetical protein V4719_28385 [Planctomycetota bacterium]
MRVIQHLTELGYHTQVEDRRDTLPNTSWIDECYVEEAELIAPGLAAALASHREGSIEVGTGHSKSNILGTICQLFHGATIFIACKTWQAAQELATDLGPFLGSAVAAVRGWNWRSNCRVVCGTFGSLEHSDPSDWQVLIFADAFEGLQETNRFARADYRHRRLYALVDHRKPKTARDELLFEMLAGPVIYRAPQLHQQPATEFLATFANYISCEKQLVNIPREQRAALWNDSPRNQAVADVALAFSSGNTSALWEYGLFLQDDWNLAILGPRPGVIIVVDSVEHGEQLHHLLTDWHFSHALSNQSETRISGTSAESWGIPRNSIVTAVAASTKLYFDCQIVVWASAGCVPFIPTRIGRSTRHLFVDFWDNSNRQLTADTQQRLNAYRLLGCRLIGNYLDQRQPELVPEGGSNHSDRQQNTSRRHRRSPRPFV